MARLARTNLLLQLSFTKDISRGDDPVYAFGMRLRQRQFTQANFDLNDLNRPQPIGNFSSRFSGSWMAFDSFKTQKAIRSADLMKSSAASNATAVNQQIILHVVQAYESVLFAERKIDVVQHEQETAAALLGLVRVKMLPFDNKSELQIILNILDGTPLEQTARVAQALGDELAAQPEVLNYQVYAGTSGPYNFNGLVRHYYLRHALNQADIQVNLLPADKRSAQSHTIAKWFRPLLIATGNQYGARIHVSEVPPGPPVVQTLVAEVYSPDLDGQCNCVLFWCSTTWRN